MAFNNKNLAGFPLDFLWENVVFFDFFVLIFLWIFIDGIIEVIEEQLIFLMNYKL